MDRVYLEFTGNATRYIHTHFPLLHCFYCLFHPGFLVCMMIKFKITKKKEEKRRGHYKTAATKRLSFFLPIKAYVKRSDVAYF